ncbi:MAG: LPS assembly lipoprotein LptE [Candidatus Omnitrophota bacterium]|nr:LPS assembly lipoprotein LptE [Candidatus Omnitrophota bacterium]
MIRLLILIFIILNGCGYTTRGFVYSEKNIAIAPVVNNISITSEDRKYSTFTSYPVLLENRVTNALRNKFNIDGHLKVVGDEVDALRLTCAINEYKREVTRYTNTDDVKEQRLRLAVHMKLTNPKGEVTKEKDVVGETSYFLTGANSMSESAAQDKLIDDTTRRILEAVIEEW